MLNMITDPTAANLNNEINRLIYEMDGVSGTTEDYAAMADQLEKLYKMKDISRPNRVSADVLVAAAANIAGILLITNFEKTGVVTSKALAFVARIK